MIFKRWQRSASLHQIKITNWKLWWVLRLSSVNIYALWILCLYEMLSCSKFHVVSLFSLWYNDFQTVAMISMKERQCYTILLWILIGNISSASMRCHSWCGLIKLFLWHYNLQLQQWFPSNKTLQALHLSSVKISSTRCIFCLYEMLLSDVSGQTKISHVESLPAQLCLNMLESLE